jgi:hypothetical protein
MLMAADPRSPIVGGPLSAAGGGRRTVLTAPGVVEPFETQLAPTGVRPETEDISTPEMTEPGVMEQDDRVLALAGACG